MVIEMPGPYVTGDVEEFADSYAYYKEAVVNQRLAYLILPPQRYEAEDRCSTIPKSMVESIPKPRPSVKTRGRRKSKPTPAE